MMARLALIGALGLASCNDTRAADPLGELQRWLWPPPPAPVVPAPETQVDPPVADEQLEEQRPEPQVDPPPVVDETWPVPAPRPRPAPPRPRPVHQSAESAAFCAHVRKAIGRPCWQLRMGVSEYDSYTPAQKRQARACLPPAERRRIENCFPKQPGETR